VADNRNTYPPPSRLLPDRFHLTAARPMLGWSPSWLIHGEPLAELF
jgi:hypothetical protein